MYIQKMHETGKKTTDLIPLFHILLCIFPYDVKKLSFYRIVSFQSMIKKCQITDKANSQENIKT